MKIAISIVLMGFFTISFAQKSDSTRWLKIGELEIGQVSGAIDKIQTVKEVIDEIIAEYNEVIKKLDSNYL